MSRFIVTGGLGFIGSHITDALIKDGHDVFVADISDRKDTINSEAKYFKVDIRNVEAMDDLFYSARADGVAHCAALARIQPSFENPEEYFSTNAIGTANILSLSKKYNVGRVVYSASSSAYGETDSPFRESAKITSQALHPYGSTKRMGEMLMRDMGKITGGPETVCLRYFNIYGPRQTTAIDGPYATLIGIFFEFKKNKKPFPVVPDGRQKRDFTFVGDVVSANIKALKSRNVGGGEIINIGNGQSRSIWEVVCLIHGLGRDTSSEEIIKNGLAEFASPRRGEVQETLADNSLAGKLLEWEPRVSFEEGIEICRNFYRRKGWEV